MSNKDLSQTVNGCRVNSRRDGPAGAWVGVVELGGQEVHRTAPFSGACAKSRARSAAAEWAFARPKA